MKTHGEHARWLLTLLTWQLLSPACAAAYSVQLRWNAPAGPTVAGYHLYVREGAGAYGLWRDIVADGTSDGGFTTVLGDLAVEQTYTFALSAYTADGRESARSNERTIDYAAAALIVDSDGDGLTDAEEDTNLNGVQDPGETDRLRADSDGDLVPDGIESARGSDPLDATSPACEVLPFTDFAFGYGGVAEIAYDTAIDDTVLHVTETSRASLHFRIAYPAHRAAAVHGPVLATEIRSARRFRIEVAVRSTLGNRYILRYEGNGGTDRRSSRSLTLALGDAFDVGDGYASVARDLADDLARLDPSAVLDTITHVRIRGNYTLRELRTCQ
ncbi:MAG: fibronectin type III domain-containing protein [Deltaproteobacteria bacterium]|nr:fibronectin type III domain-containing protein [Deltaproteobacteria bacterium]